MIPQPAPRPLDVPSDVRSAPGRPGRGVSWVSLSAPGVSWVAPDGDHGLRDDVTVHQAAEVKR
ncbi:hypothetical protein ACQPZP_43065 [Spirillospora sp. CA-142024]|uniref:hypothetical protein n=1 Tax=Spirillospora sp. CA-142024 TaxID=3240036 RepID=UPI003D936995